MISYFVCHFKICIKRQVLPVSIILSILERILKKDWVNDEYLSMNIINKV